MTKHNLVVLLQKSEDLNKLRKPVFSDNRTYRSGRRQFYLTLGLTSGYGVRFRDESFQTSADGVAEGVWHAHRSRSTGWRVARVRLLNAPNSGCYKKNIEAKLSPAFYACVYCNELHFDLITLVTELGLLPL